MNRLNYGDPRLLFWEACTLNGVALSAMENFVVAADAVKPVKRIRQSHADDFIAKAVVLARQLGATAATAQLHRDYPLLEPVKVDTVGRWLSRWKKEGDFWSLERSKRGRPNAMESISGAREEWTRQVDCLRAQGESVTGRVAAVIARAVVSQKAPSLLERSGGNLKISINTGQRLLASAGKTFRKGTSSRVVPPVSDLADARDKFYADIREAFPDQLPTADMVINYDQTFHLYNPNRGYTWEKRGADRVPLRKNKDGFTLLPAISATQVIGAQMIFGGGTSAVHPRVDPGPLLRYYHTDSHWSDERTTLALWQDIILPYVAAQRVSSGDPTAPVLVLADAFPAHWTSAVKGLVEQQTAVSYIAIPDSLTHYFQPLDLGVIAGIKNSVLRRKDDFLEHEVATAVAEGRGVILSKSRPVLREKLTLWIKETLSDPDICAESLCRMGFQRAGVFRVLYGEEGAHCPDVDNVVPAPTCDDCGEIGFAQRLLPNCVHFTDVDSAILCAGCMDNHTNICTRVL